MPIEYCRCASLYISWCATWEKCSGNRKSDTDSNARLFIKTAARTACSASRLTGKDLGVNSMSFRLNENFDNSTPFLSGYKKLKIPIVDDAGNPAWPELFPLEKIHELETIVGPRHFSAQMMLEYIAEERVHLDPGAINFYSDNFDNQFSKIGEHCISGVSFYWDPSFGRNGADGSVCALIYRDDKNRDVFVHDILYITVPDEDLYPLANQCETVLNFMKKNLLIRIGIEINGMGNALPEIMRSKAQQQQMSINIIQISNHEKKETRILNAIEPILTTNHLYMHE